MYNNFKTKLLLTTSLLTFLSTGVWATKEIQELAQSEFDTPNIVTRIWNTNTYQIHVDVKQEAKKIGAKVKKTGQGKAPLSQLESEASHEITRLLNFAKTAPLDQRTMPSGSILTTNFRQDDLSVAFRNTPLVYPCLEIEGLQNPREKSDAFLPRGYVSNFMSKALCDHIRTYSQSLGLDEKDAQRLNKYLQPLFYVVQREASSLLDGQVAKNLYHSPRWVYGKSYAQMQESLQHQAEHHLAMLSQANIRGLNEAQISHALTADLLGLGLSFLPNSNRVLHQDRGMVYVLGRNLNGDVSLLNPYADNLPYPVLQERRLLSRANIPHNLVLTPSAYKQWQRTDQFVEWSDYHFSDQEKRYMKWLMEGIGTLFHKHLSTFHVKQFPVDQQSMDLTKEMALSFVNNQTIPEPYLTQFYQRDIDPDIHHVLSGIKNKGDTHRSLTSDLWPARFKTEEGKTALVNESIKFLLFQDILDRYEAYKAHHKGSDLRFREITRDLDLTALKDDKGLQTSPLLNEQSVGNQPVVHYDAHVGKSSSSQSESSYPLKPKYLSSPSESSESIPSRKGFSIIAPFMPSKVPSE